MTPPCAVRWSDTFEGPYQGCTLPHGHKGRHETVTRHGNGGFAPRSDPRPAKSMPKPSGQQALAL